VFQILDSQIRGAQLIKFMQMFQTVKKSRI
jgi:hypothetical protein